MDEASVYEQINKILASRTFASKSQLRRLLEILHKHMDVQAELKPSGVIQELWPEEVRTKRSADVATEMNRLRHALEVYYESEGASDAVVICLPNRSAAAANGAQEKRWIAAYSRNGRETAEEHPLAPIASPAKRRRVYVYAGVAAAALLATYAGIRFTAGRGEPAIGRMEGSALVISNAEGKELWRRNFPGGFGSESYYEHGLASRIWFVDLEGKGHVSVLFSYLPPASTQAHPSTLICYSNRGNEKWRWTPGRALPENGGENSAYNTYSLGVLKATEDKGPRIVMVSDPNPWWGGPSQMAVLDSKGKFISEYWHSGGLRDLIVAELGGAGKEEIIATGVAYGYDDQSTLVVLDPERVFGTSKEVRPEYQIHGMGEAQERLRLLFPRSDLNRASFDHSIAIQPMVTDGRLRVTVEECLAPIGCPIEYEFDRDLALIAVHPGNDEFRSAHDRYYQNGEDAHALSVEELSAFLKLRCLVGCKMEYAPVAETYDPAASFGRGWTNHTNPDGVWSYGYSAGFKDPITLYDKTVRNGINGQNAKFWLSPTVNSQTSPAAQFNDGPAYNDGNVNLLKNEFVLVAGVRGQYSDLMFTAPGNGDYSIAGNFRGAQYGVGTVVGVVANGTMVFQSKVTAVEEEVPFQLTQQLRAGEKLVFAVGPGNGMQNTGLAVTITRPCTATDRPASTPDWEISCSGKKAASGAAR